MKHKVRYFQKWKLILGTLFCVNLSLGQTPQHPVYAFNDEGTECIVYKSDLKRPWFNRLGNDVFFTWITHHGYIESFLLDPANNGLVNPQTVSGHFYIKDNQSNDFFLINESDGGDHWRGVIGLGYSQFFEGC